MELLVERQGTVRCLYQETIDLSSLGVPSLERASHVEPDQAARWWAELLPVNGPRLGPFTFRSEALAAERQWLVTHWLFCSAHKVS